MKGAFVPPKLLYEEVYFKKSNRTYNSFIYGSIIAFLLIRLAPGDPAQILAG